MRVVKRPKSVLLNPWIFIVLPWAPYLLSRILSNFATPNWLLALFLFLLFVIPLAALVYSKLLTQTDKSLQIHFNGLVLRFSASVYFVIMVGNGLIEQIKEDHSAMGLVLFGAFVAGYFVKLYDHWEIRSGDAKIAWAAELLAVLNQSNEKIKDEQIPTCFLKNSPACVFENCPTCLSLGMPLCDWKQDHQGLAR